MQEAYELLGIGGEEEAIEGHEGFSQGQLTLIARAIVGADVDVVTFANGGTKYIDAADFMEMLRYEDTLFDVDLDKFRDGERRREQLLVPFRGGYI